MHKKLFSILVISFGSQALYGAKRVEALPVGQYEAEQVNAAQERAREMHATVAAERARHAERQAQARNAAQRMLEQSQALREEAQRAGNLSADERTTLRETLQNYAQRLDDEALYGRSRIYGQMPNRLQRAARVLRGSAQELLGQQRPVRHISFLAPRRQEFSTMPITANNSPQNVNNESDSSDTE